MKALICHALFKHINRTKQKGSLLLHRNSPALKYLPLSTHEIKSHIPSCKGRSHLFTLAIFLLKFFHGSYLRRFYLFTCDFHFIAIIHHTLLVLVAQVYLFLDHLLSFLLFLLCDVSLACVSELGKDVLLHVIKHAAHHLGFMEVEGGPLSPLLEPRGSCVGIESLHIVSKLFVSFGYYHFLKVFDVFVSFGCTVFMLSYLFILQSDFIRSTVLLLLMFEHLFHMCVFFPSLKSALFLLSIEIIENASPPFLSLQVMVSEGAEGMVVLPHHS